MSLETQLAELQVQFSDVAALTWDRFMEMVFVPVRNPDMLWAVVPLIIAVTFMTLYFGRYRKEELGWNDAFGNAMIFLFTAISLIKQMYYDTGSLSFDALAANPTYLFFSVVLALASLLLMFITYFRFIPKRLAFFIFSAPPVNLALYVIITMIYAGIPADFITLLAAIVMFLFVFALTETVKLLVYLVMGYHAPDEAAASPAPRIPSQDRKAEGRPARKKEEKPSRSHAPADDTGVDLKILSEE